MVEEYFADREMLTATTVVFDPVYVPVNVSLEVAVKENYMRSTLKMRCVVLCEISFYSQMSTSSVRVHE